MKTLLSFLLTISLFSSFVPSSSFAQGKEESKIDQKTLRCVFENPLEVGASVTGRVGESVPFFAHVESYFFGMKKGDYSGSPSSFFLTHYREMDPLYFSEQKWKKTGYDGDTSGKHWRNIAYPITNDLSHVGSGQVLRMLDGDRRRAFDKASIVMSLDLFYWDAIWGRCGYGNAYYDKLDVAGIKGREFRMDTEHLIARFTAEAAKTGKVLVLSTLPFEDPNLVPINSTKPGATPGFWYPQNYQCVASINEALKANCKQEKNCYLIDMGKIAGDLNQGKKVIVKSEGKEIGLFEARPDGVHLSRLGSLAVSEKIIEVFEDHPPYCSPVRDPSSVKKK